MRRGLRVLAALVAASMVVQIPVAGAARVDSLSAAGANTLWIAGSNDAGGFISRSTDGGETWQATLLPDPLVPTGVQGRADGSSAIAVVDAEDLVLTTTDGGSTWTTDTPAIGSGDPNLYDAVWLEGTPGVRLAVGEYASPLNGDVFAIARSAALSGGWTLPFTGPFYPAPDEFTPPPATRASGWAIDATGSAVFAIGYENDPSGDTIAFLRPLVYKSTDSGSTWTTAVASNVSLSNYPTAVDVVNSGLAYVGLGNARRVLRSTTATPAGYFDLPNFSPTPSSYGLDALDADKMLVAGRLGVVGWSSNASAASPTFTYKVLPGSTGYAAPELRAAAMLDASRWIVVGTNEAIYRTSNAGVTWTGGNAVAAPGVTMTVPAAGFALDAGPVTISGTSADAGVGVARVEVRIRRADGQTWNGVAWTAGDTWLPATRNGGTWNSWTTTWTPDGALIASGQLVTIAARATDGMLQTKTAAGVTSASGAAGTPSISLADGAAYTKDSGVAAAVSTAGYSQMRYRVNGGAPSAWAPAASSAIVALGAGDGLKTVVFDFSNDGSTVNATATDTVTLDTSAPNVSITSPSAGFSLASASVSVAGTASDGSSGVSAAEVRIARGTQYWNGAQWGEAEVWLPATGSTTWSYQWAPDAETQNGSQAVTLVARASDVAGNVGTSASVVSAAKLATALSISAPAGPLRYGSAVSVTGTLSAGPGKTVTIEQIETATGLVTQIGTPVTTTNGRFSLTAPAATRNVGFRASFAGDATNGSSTSTVASTSVYASVTTPIVSVTRARPRARLPFMPRVSVSGAVLPAHAAGTTAVTLMFERYVVRYGKGVWVKQRSTTRTFAANGTGYSAVVYLPYRGSWRVRAIHSDASHVKTVGGWRTFTAR